MHKLAFFIKFGNFFLPLFRLFSCFSFSGIPIVHILLHEMVFQSSLRIFLFFLFFRLDDLYYSIMFAHFTFYQLKSAFELLGEFFILVTTFLNSRISIWFSLKFSISFVDILIFKNLTDLLKYNSYTKNCTYLMSAIG